MNKAIHRAHTEGFSCTLQLIVDNRRKPSVVATGSRQRRFGSYGGRAAVISAMAATTHRRIRGARDEAQPESRGKISSISSEESPRDCEDIFPIGKIVCGSSTNDLGKRWAVKWRQMQQRRWRRGHGLSVSSGNAGPIIEARIVFPHCRNDIY